MRSTKQCAVCEKRFVCGGASGACWCSDFPKILPPDGGGDCHCPACLAKMIGREIESRLAELPHPEALQAAMAERPSSRLVEHIDYIIEDGSYVFSSWYLLKQGNCCGNGCRNCPYPDAV